MPDWPSASVYVLVPVVLMIVTAGLDATPAPVYCLVIDARYQPLPAFVMLVADGDPVVVVIAPVARLMLMYVSVPNTVALPSCSLT